MNALPVYRTSFFLSQKRKDGLRLRAIYAGDHVYTDFRIDERFQSETGSLYNGIIFGITDVLMWYTLIMQTKKMCMTKNIDIEFLEPISCDVPYRAKSRLLNADEKDFHVSAWIEDHNGHVCARITALFKESRNTNIREIVDSFDFSETTPEMKAFFDSSVW